MNADSARDSAQRWRPHQAGGRGAPPRARRLVRASGYRTCSHRWAVRRACPACGHPGAEALGDGRFKRRVFPLILGLLQETPVAAGDPGYIGPERVGITLRKNSKD